MPRPRSLIALVAAVAFEAILAYCLCQWALYESLRVKLDYGESPNGTDFGTIAGEPLAATAWVMLNLLALPIVAVARIVERSLRAGRAIRPRLAVRDSLVVVAIVGAMLVWPMDRYKRFRRLASHHLLLAQDASSWPLYGYHKEMARKYDRATRFLWLPIAPDPAKPL